MAVGPGAEAAVTRNIQHQTCTTGTANWLHLYTTNHGTVCYGFRGVSHPDVYAKSFCPGNNTGSIHWISPMGAPQGTDFFPGEGPIPMGSRFDYVSNIDIISWSGNGTC
jgi:hypothetical protein